MALAVMVEVGERGSGSWERTSLRRRVWMEGCLQSMQIAKERAEAVVSWPAMRKVISWFTRPSSVKPPDSMATERMFLAASCFLLARFAFCSCTRE